jgi:hypothetical protein
MRLFKTLLLLTIITVPVSALAQQDSAAFSAGKDNGQNYSPKAFSLKTVGDSTKPAMAIPYNDPIGNEEEMDAEDGFDYKEWLLMWPEQDEDREYDPMDPREDAQEADTRE